MVVAIRPLRVQELAEIFAIDFDLDTVTAPYLMNAWRPENPEEAILSTCSTLISVIDYFGSKVVQFSHFSVKEFLISDRLRTSEIGNIRDGHIRLDAAHMLLARACLTVLLHVDEKTDWKQLATLPLVFYAAQHWFEHAKYEGVAPQVQDAMEELFNPSKPYLTSWVWIHDVDGLWYYSSSIHILRNRRLRLEGTALYYAVSCGLSGPAKYLISTHGEDVNAKSGKRGTPLHAASYRGHLDAVSLLLDHGAEVNVTNRHGMTPLSEAYHGRHLQVMQLLLEHGAAPDVLVSYHFGLMIHDASHHGQAEVIRLLLQHNVDVNDTSGSLLSFTPLHQASSQGHADVAQILLEHGADIDAPSQCGTPLLWAVENEHFDVTRLLLERGADAQARNAQDLTLFQVAIQKRNTQIAQLLLEHGADKE